MGSGNPLKKIEKEAKRFGRKIDDEIIQPVIQLAEDVVNFIGEAIFGTDTIYSTQVSVSGLLESNPDAFKETVVSAVLKKQNRSTVLTESALKNHYVQSKRMYQYCLDNYPDGTPEGTYTTANVDFEALSFVIKSIAGNNVYISSNFVDYPDSNFYIQKYLVENTDYDPVNNVLPTHNVRDASGNRITRPLKLHSASFIEKDNGEIVLRAYYYYFINDVSYDADARYYDYTVTNIDFDSMYYHAIYTKTAGKQSTVNSVYSTAYIQNYKKELEEKWTKEYPVLTGEYVIDYDSAEKELFAWAYTHGITPLQLARAIDWSENAVYERAQEMGFTYVEEEEEYDTEYFFSIVGNSAYPTLPNKNSINYSSAYLPIIYLKYNKTNVTKYGDSNRLTTTKRALKYIGVDVDTILDAVDDSSNNPDTDKVTDAFITYQLDIATDTEESAKYFIQYFTARANHAETSSTEWHKWKEEVKSENNSLAPYNTYEVKEGIFNLQAIYSYIDVNTVYGSIGKVGTATTTRVMRDKFSYKGYTRGSNGKAKSTTFYVDRNSVVFREQIGVNTYKEVAVYGLFTVTDVRGRGTVYNYIGDSIRMPVSIDALENMQFRDATAICYDSTSLVIYAIHEQKLKWYETARFLSFVKISLYVVAIVLAIPSGGSSFTLLAAALALLEFVAYNYAISLIVEELVDIVGGKWALILATVAAIYALQGGDASKISALFPNAVQLLSISTTMMDEVAKVQNEKTQSAIDDLIQSGELYKTEQERLDDAYDMLDDSTDFLMDITRAGFYYNVKETPTEMYERMVHTPNSGVLNYEALHNYADTMLTLPTAL